MKSNRRNFLKSASLGAAASPLLFHSFTSTDPKDLYFQDLSDLEKIMKQPVLKKELFNAPVILDKVELLQYRNNYICRVTTPDGQEGISVSNNMQMQYLYPIFTKRIQPFFIGKDATKLEELLEEVYVYKSNYKLQSLALWVPLATLEFAVLDLLGKIANKPMGALIGDIHHEKIAVYQANNFRGKSAEETVERIKENAERINANAIKFKVAGRMSAPDSPPNRSENLIPLIRKTFGDDMTIYADANGGYNVAEAIKIGKLLQEYDMGFFEEPVPFDMYEETLAVAEALDIPIAGGEQEPSMNNFRWLIHHDALDVVQPDIFYFGGMIRSMKVALMGHHKNKPCIPHISGSGLGYLYMMHFVSALPNAGPYHEFKGFNNEIPLESPTSNLKSENGKVKVPTAPGLGVYIDPDYIEKHTIVKG